MVSFLPKVSIPDSAGEGGNVQQDTGATPVKDAVRSRQFDTVSVRKNRLSESLLFRHQAG